jgi:hypothetical protein
MKKGGNSAMPSGKNRHRVEVSEETYRELATLAAWEGWPITVLADLLLSLAMAKYSEHAPLILGCRRRCAGHT